MGKHAAAEQAGFAAEHRVTVNADFHRGKLRVAEGHVGGDWLGRASCEGDPDTPSLRAWLLATNHWSEELQPVSRRIHSGGWPATPTRTQKASLRRESGRTVAPVAFTSMLQQAKGEMEWLRREFQLSDAQFESVRRKHQEYAPAWDTICAKIMTANVRLEDLIQKPENFNS